MKFDMDLIGMAAAIWVVGIIVGGIGIAVYAAIWGI